MTFHMTHWDGEPIPEPNEYDITLQRPEPREIDWDYPPGSFAEASYNLRTAVRACWDATGIERRIVWLLERMTRLLRH